MMGQRQGEPPNPMTESIIKTYMSEIDQDDKLKAAREFCRATGKTLAYLTPEGKLIDGDGKEVEKTPETIVVRLSG